MTDIPRKSSAALDRIARAISVLAESGDPAATWLVDALLAWVQPDSEISLDIVLGLPNRWRNQRRQARLDRRDDAIRAALARYDGAPTGRARALAVDLAAPDPSPWASEIVAMNNRQPLKYRQIMSIADGVRCS